MLLRTSSFVWLAVTATAQLNLLTPREAIQVFAMIPEIAKAKKEGFCPRFEARYGDEASNLGVQVRYGCGPYAGALIGNYGVDLWTGAVHQGESKKRISNPEGQALAKTLLQAAASRILSENEARCLALAAARSLPDWEGAGRDVSVEQLGSLAIRFHGRLRTRDRPPMVTERFLTVDRATASVRDDTTGIEVVSASLASLKSIMLALRLPLMLSESDALEIARQVPEVQAEAGKPCSAYSVGGPLSWEDIYVGVQSHCNGGSEESHITVGINPKTGAVSDPASQRHFESPTGERIARERLQGHERERARLRDAVDRACRKE